MNDIILKPMKFLFTFLLFSQFAQAGFATKIKGDVMGFNEKELIVFSDGKRFVLGRPRGLLIFHRQK